MARFTTSDGLSLYFEDQGSGRPVLCLAGLTRNARDFDFVAPYLSSQRMIALDYRGRGRSDRDPVYANYNVLRESQDVIELLDHLMINRCTIIGTSRGGLIAMLLAAGHKDRLAGVVLNDVGPELDTDGLARIVALVGQTPRERTLDEAAHALNERMSAEFPGLPYERVRAAASVTNREVPGGLELTYDPALAAALAEQIADGPAPDLWPLFQALDGLPVGVIRGINSDILSAQTLAVMQTRLPGLVAATVPDRGHAPFLDEPESLDVITKILEAS